MSQRSDIDARYNKHLINGHGSAKAWDMAVSELGGNFGHFKLVDGEVQTTSTYDKEQADIKKYQKDYDNWLETDNTDATNTANAKTVTKTTTAPLVVEDNSTVSGGGYTDTKTNYITTDTPESLMYKAKAATLKEQEDAIKARVRASGKNGRALLTDPDVKRATAERKAAELAEERAQKHTTTQTTTYHDANGNEVSKDEYISHTKNPSTGAVENVVKTNAQLDGKKFDDTGEEVPIPSDSSTDSTAGLATEPTSPDYGCSVDEIYDDATMMCVPKPSTHDDAVQMDSSLNTDANNQTEAEPTPEPSVAELRQNKASKDDWRVRLRLAPQSDYLYNAQDPGILAPLAETDGIIFPYMPRIDTVHQARYNSYDLTHSNYRGYFYAGSHQERVIISATFTAQDTKEANYMLAALHFLRSCTKMFYGQDMQRGTPPPLVFLSGLGDHQFNEHPCAVEIVNINLPNDVDYIKAGDANARSGDFMSPLNSPRTSSAPSFSGALNRLFGSGMSFGGTPAPTHTSENIFKAEGKGTTRMPTKMDINFNLVPIQTRDQVSNEYSLKDYSNGSLLKKGFW